MSKVDVILTYFNTDALVDIAIPNLLKTQYDEFEIYIMDNSHVSKEILKSKFPDKRVHVLPGAPLPPPHRGYKRGQHHPNGIEVGLECTSSPYVALFHCDSWPLKSNWLTKCFTLKEQHKVELIGIQHESSIHHSFHFFERDLLKRYDYHYNVKKRSFGKSVKKLVRHPEVMIPRRHKWDWGEDLAIKIYESGKRTLGFIPSFACVDPEDQFPYKAKWETLRSYCNGIVYGDTVFHSWKSYKNSKKRQLSLDQYESGKYLKEAYYPNQDNPSFVINDGIHENGVYLTNVLIKKEA